MDVSCQLSPVNFHSESSPLSSQGIELTLFGYVTGFNQRPYPLYRVSLRTSVYDKHGDKDVDNSPENVNNVRIPHLRNIDCKLSNFIAQLFVSSLT